MGHRRPLLGIPFSALTTHPLPGGFQFFSSSFKTLFHHNLSFLLPLHFFSRSLPSPHSLILLNLSCFMDTPGRRTATTTTLMPPRRGRVKAQIFQSLSGTVSRAVHALCTLGGSSDSASAAAAAVTSTSASTSAAASISNSSAATPPVAFSPDRSPSPA